MANKRVDDQSKISKSMLEDVEEVFGRYLSKIHLKQTAQRQTILRTFVETRDHLSVEELLRFVQKRDPKIGVTTVYRTLKLLVDAGLASTLELHDGVVRYEHQYNRRSHHHMVCTECGESVEFFSPEIEEIEKKIGKQFKYRTVGHNFQIRGVCSGCRKKS
jgi:Fur family ferric uptake transcriptional regulator